MDENSKNPLILAMDEVKSVFNRFSNLVDRDIKGVHIGCYSVALIGLTIAIRKVRPFSKFKKPTDIPNHFLTEKRELTGLVKRIDPNGGILMVEHKPLVDIPLIPKGQLPVKISGVDVKGFGLTWLHHIVSGHEIRFIPITKDANVVQCQVMLVQKTKDNKEELLNIGERLLKIGFGQTQPFHRPLNDPSLVSYFNRLHAAEQYALRKKLGLKYYIKPTVKAVNILAKNLNDLSKSLTIGAKKSIQYVNQLSTA